MTTFTCLGNNKYLWFIMFSGRKLLTCTSQADILHANHNCEVVIYHKHGSSDTVTFYGTQGPGVAFIGNKKDKKSSQHGEMALKLFCNFMEGNKLLQLTATLFFSRSTIIDT